MSIPIQVSHLMYFIVSVFLSTSFYLWTLVCLFPDVVNSYCNHSYYNHNNCRWVYQMLHIKNVIWTNWYINSKEDPFILKKINVWIKPPQKNLFINSNCVAKKSSESNFKEKYLRNERILPFSQLILLAWEKVTSSIMV